MGQRIGMIVGMNPGAEEEAQGRPFVGASGRLLDQALEAAGLPRSDVFITNVYKARTPNNRVPTDEELDEHCFYIFEEIRKVDPKFIICLGGCASREFWGEGFPGIGQVLTKDEWFVLSNNGRKYKFTYHPSYILHGQTWAKEILFRDIGAFARRVR